MGQAMSLREALAEVPDPRAASGRRYPLDAILMLATVALAGGARNLLAIAQFGRDRGPEFARALGFTRGRTPCCTTLHYLFKRLDARAFAAALQRWWNSQTEGAWETLSLDGKTLQGTATVGKPGLHVLSVYAHEAPQVLQQVPVDAQTNEHKTALALLPQLPLKEKVVLGDAMFCQRDLSRRVLKRQADYVWPLKANQPNLLADVRLLFEQPDFSPVGAGRGATRT
jgi:hypothetical protein